MHSYSIRKLIPLTMLSVRIVPKCRTTVYMLNIIVGCLSPAFRKIIRLEKPCMNVFPDFSQIQDSRGIINDEHHFWQQPPPPNPASLQMQKEGVLILFSATTITANTSGGVSYLFLGNNHHDHCLPHSKCKRRGSHSVLSNKMWVEGFLVAFLATTTTPSLIPNARGGGFCSVLRTIIMTTPSLAPNVRGGVLILFSATITTPSLATNVSRGVSCCFLSDNHHHHPLPHSKCKRRGFLFCSQQAPP